MLKEIEMSGENSERTGRAQIEMAEENFERMGKSKIEIEIAGEENSERMRRTEIARKENEDNLSTDQIFESKEVLSWRNQLTVRAFVVSAVLTFFFSFIVMKLSLTTGFIPPLNTAAGVLGFFFTKTWTTVLKKTGLLHQPFTRQENTIIQACVGAATGIAYSGGFGGYMLGMSEIIASRAGIGNTPINIKNPSLGWMIGFFFVVSFVGIFLVVPLGKILIINHKLIYPSGTATAHLINSFHAPQGAKQVKKQASTIFKTFGFSFFWAFFQWFFTAGENCGFVAFPTFGLKAYEHKFYFDFSATYVGVGMLCPYIINISLLLGAVLSWGIMWPLIEAKKGDWFSAKLSPNSLQGLQGYKVFISIAVILGDGLLHFSIVFYKTIPVFFRKMMRKDKTIPVVGTLSPDNASSVSYDEQRRTELFLKDQIPYMYAFIGYIVLAIVSITTVPYIFPQLKWYHVLVTYIIAPIMAFCNSYGSGLTDWSLAGIYGNLAIFIFAAWIGMNSGGVLAGLATGGVMMSIVSTATYLMEDLKAGYLTLTSPRSMLISQVIGTAMGCIIAPCVFWFFYRAFPLGVEGSSYPAPYATVHRGIALLGVEGISSLPKNCLTLCLAFFIGAFLLSGAREVAEHYELRVSNYMPSIMAMAIPLYLGSYFVIDMCLGSLIFFIWERTNKKNANAFKSSVASGMICGDSIWSLPASLLAVAKVDPPICMKFLPRSTNAKVDGFLTG